MPNPAHIIIFTLLLTSTVAILPTIEPIGQTPKCPRMSLRKMKSLSQSFLNALHTCFNENSGDDFLPIYGNNVIVFGTSGVLIGRDAFIGTFPACEMPPPAGVQGLKITRVLESIARNSVYYLITVRAEGFQDYNFSTSHTACRSKIVRTTSTLDTLELVPIH